MRKVEFVVGGDVESVVVKKEGVKGGPEGVDVRGEEGGSVGDVVRGVSSEGRSGVEGRSESSDLVKGEGSPHWSSSSSSDAVDTCMPLVAAWSCGVVHDGEVVGCQIGPVWMYWSHSLSRCLSLQPFSDLPSPPPLPLPLPSASLVFPLPPLPPWSACHSPPHHRLHSQLYLPSLTDP